VAQGWALPGTDEAEALLVWPQSVAPSSWLARESGLGSNKLGGTGPNKKSGEYVRQCSGTEGHAPEELLAERSAR
jgi:hypothetical protein